MKKGLIIAVMTMLLGLPSIWIIPLLAASGAAGSKAATAKVSTSSGMDQTQKDYLQQAQTEFAALDLLLEQYRLKLARSISPNKDILVQLSEELEMTRAKANQKLREIKSKTGAEWDKTKSELDSALSAWRQDMDQFISYF